VREWPAADRGHYSAPSRERFVGLGSKPSDRFRNTRNAPVRANLLTLVDFADATFRAGSTEIERPRAVGSNKIRCEWPAMGRRRSILYRPGIGSNGWKAGIVEEAFF
jgi:hypothetical protein